MKTKAQIICAFLYFDGLGYDFPCQKKTLLGGEQGQLVQERLLLLL